MSSDTPRSLLPSGFATLSATRASMADPQRLPLSGDQSPEPAGNVRRCRVSARTAGETHRGSTHPAMPLPRVVSCGRGRWRGTVSNPRAHFGRDVAMPHVVEPFARQTPVRRTDAGRRRVSVRWTGDSLRAFGPEFAVVLGGEIVGHRAAGCPHGQYRPVEALLGRFGPGRPWGEPGPFGLPVWAKVVHHRCICRAKAPDGPVHGIGRLIRLVNR